MIHTIHVESDLFDKLWENTLKSVELEYGTYHIGDTIFIKAVCPYCKCTTNQLYIFAEITATKTVETKDGPISHLNLSNIIRDTF